MLGNKNDLPGALKAEELVDKLYVERKHHGMGSSLDRRLIRARSCRQGPGQSDRQGMQVGKETTQPVLLSAIQGCANGTDGSSYSIYSISCLNSTNIDITLEWLIRRA